MVCDSKPLRKRKARCFRDDAKPCSRNHSHRWRTSLHPAPAESPVSNPWIGDSCARFAFSNRALLQGGYDTLVRANGHASFAWQSRFYDHIIRGNRGVDAVREYIRLNPENWLHDEFHPSIAQPET